jgi:uncharacterized membrane protein
LRPEGKTEAFAGHTWSFKDYITDVWRIWWFYLSIIVAISELLLVVSNVQTGFFLFLRILFGLGILGIIPGFLTVLMLFPEGHLNVLEKIALSIFLSVLASITVGVLLGLGPFFQASNDIAVLAGYIILMDVVASYRTYRFILNASQPT